MTTATHIHAIIFDFDGVLVDTEPLHHQAFCEVVKPHGLECDWPEYVQEYIGFDDRDLFRTAFQRGGQSLTDAELQDLVDAKAEAFVALASRGVPPYPGVPDIVRNAASRWPVGLCSGALRSDIAPLLKQLDLEDTFLVKVTAEDVPASKPDPTCYRMTIEKLTEQTGIELDPSRCIAIEDTPTGVAAAAGAQLRTWAVIHTHSSDQLTAAERVFESLPDLWNALLKESP